MRLKRNRLIFFLTGLLALVFLSSCSSPVSIVQKSRSIGLGNITGHYNSDLSEGEVKKVILYMKESAVIKRVEKFDFTLEKQKAEYRVIIDLVDMSKLNLTESPAALIDLFGSSGSSKKLGEEQLLQVLLRGLAIGLTEDVLNEYTEIRVKDNEKKQYRIYPPSFE